RALRRPRPPNSHAHAARAHGPLGSRAPHRRLRHPRRRRSPAAQRSHRGPQRSPRHCHRRVWRAHAPPSRPASRTRRRRHRAPARNLCRARSYCRPSPLRCRQMTRLLSLAKGAWLVILILAAWETFARLHIVDPLFFPPPSTLLATIGALTLNGVIPRQVMYTLERTAIGFGVGVVWGVTASAILSLSATLRRASEPLVSALYSTPRLTLLPMVMLLLGVNNFARILLVA